MNFMHMSINDITNGAGVRTVLWVAGCNHKCKGCHNPETWDINAGSEYTSADHLKLLASLKPYYISGLTLSGGDPLHPNNRDRVASIINGVKSLYGNTKNIWCYTGYSWEEAKCFIGEGFPLDKIDVMVCDEFDIDHKDATYHYAGSTNQRVINVKRTLEIGSIVLYNK